MEYERYIKSDKAGFFLAVLSFGTLSWHPSLPCLVFLFLLLLFTSVREDTVVHILFSGDCTKWRTNLRIFLCESCRCRVSHDSRSCTGPMITVRKS